MRLMTGMLNTKIKKYSNLLPTIFSGISFRSFEIEMNKCSENLGFDVSSINEIKGDLFEIFGSLFLMFFGDRLPYLMLSDFKLSQIDDYGVDGSGITCEGARTYPVVVQFKYRSNVKNIISYSDLSKTFSQGIMEYNLNKDDKHNLYLMTTGTVSYNADYLKDHLVVIDKKKIESNVDGHYFFWSYCQNIIAKS